ncbi:MAG TPA: CvpA family protein [Prolixibacteraceae bacterium]|nr:CvpA family protein [Prolixibacteraceae bacterium]
MNYIDIIIAILLLFSAIGGLNKGFIYEFSSLFGLIAGVWGAIKFSGALSDFLTYKLNFDGNYVEIIAFVLTFVVILILVHIVAKAIEHALEAVAMGVVNRIFGAILAVFKTAFFLGVLFLFLQKVEKVVPVIPDKAIQESHLYNPLRNVAVYSFPFLKGLYDDIKDKPDDDQKNTTKKTAPVV